MLNNTYDVTAFKNNLKEFGLALTENQVEQYLRYYELLVEWNEKMNLTAITEYGDVMKKHFIDSLSIVKAIDPKSISYMIDVGTGAGFPGLALKIAFPEIKVTLLDSLNKRITFLNAVIDELKLKDVEAVHGRAEDFAGKTDYREKYDLCVSRAVANLSTLSEYCLPFVNNNGCFISYKSEKIEEELKQAENAISILGGKIEKQVEFNLPSSDIYRNLVVIRKMKVTPKKYPRKAGLPSKEPLK